MLISPSLISNIVYGKKNSDKNSGGDISDGEGSSDTGSSNNPPDDSSQPTTPPDKIKVNG